MPGSSSLWPAIYQKAVLREFECQALRSSLLFMATYRNAGNKHALYRNCQCIQEYNHKQFPKRRVYFQNKQAQ